MTLLPSPTRRVKCRVALLLALLAALLLALLLALLAALSGTGSSLLTGGRLWRYAARGPCLRLPSVI
jgi:hypothetical protein